MGKTTYPDDFMLTRAQVAEWLGLHERTVSLLVADEAHPLPAVFYAKQYRFRAAEVRAWIEARRVMSASWSGARGVPGVRSKAA